MKEVLKFIVLIIFKTFYRVKVTGLENIPEKGAALLCSNHLGMLDMFLIGYRTKRLVHWMAKEELFKNRFFGAFIKRLGAFPVKRGTGDISAVKTVYKLLKEGNIVGIFPEGTRNSRKNMMRLKAHPGAAMFAVNSGAPVLPVAIKGDRKLFGKITVVFGKPFYPEYDKAKKHSTEELSAISKNIMDIIYGMLEE